MYRVHEFQIINNINFVCAYTDLEVAHRPDEDEQHNYHKWYQYCESYSQQVLRVVFTRTHSPCVFQGHTKQPIEFLKTKYSGDSTIRHHMEIHFCC